MFVCLIKMPKESRPLSVASNTKKSRFTFNERGGWRPLLAECLYIICAAQYTSVPTQERSLNGFDVYLTSYLAYYSRMHLGIVHPRPSCTFEESVSTWTRWLANPR